VLLPALGKIWASGKALQLVIAPHEPTPEHVDPLLQKLSELGANPRLFSEIESGKKPAGPASSAVIIDSVGKLYKLYKLADLAFVGGSFRKEVHNVMEPAGFGIPVFFGPKIKNSVEALKLAERKGGFMVQNAEQLYENLTGFIDDEPKRLEAGKQALELVRENMGAGERTYQALAESFPRLLNSGKKN
jgi:3-deoxy-D-manno-octulosonic-acid transferase